MAIDPMESYTVTSDGCWMWGRALNTTGYGQFRLEDRSMKVAHIYFYEQFCGPIPDGLEVDHLCEQRACVNPEHLEAVTHTENVRRSRQTKLDPKSVKMIRKMRKAGVPVKKIARRFDVSFYAVYDILSGRTWTEVA